MHRVIIIQLISCIIISNNFRTASPVQSPRQGIAPALRGNALHITTLHRDACDFTIISPPAPKKTHSQSVNNPAPSIPQPCLALPRCAMYPTPATTCQGAFVQQELARSNSLLLVPFSGFLYLSRLACSSANLSLHSKPAPGNLQKTNSEPSRPMSHFLVVHHGFCAATALTSCKAPRKPRVGNSAQECNAANAYPLSRLA
ncbi:hypothetical protein FALBO_4475 [Fusarium albosuccineum]|uniref:Uncharacterized protein n=1 Tax=Fusarium albosuccineum TaxID=1237068 RepID=A0A8H4LIR3_9HYPO|nr:hypothetical protein FALBO_4475 [Fusarium albosuccineum]